MKKCLAFLLILLFTNVYSFEILPEVNCKFEKSWLTISYKDITLQHSENISPQSSRDLITINGKNIMIIDFDCDGVIDVLFMNGKLLSRKNNPYEFKKYEELISNWKNKVGYEFLKTLWKNSKK